MKIFTIGALASACSVSVETVRYYQRVGIINEPKKPSSGYRQYAPDIADRILFIKRAQRLGFTLEEISELLNLGNAKCADVRTRAEAKRKQIDAQIRDLQALRNTLDMLINDCRHQGKTLGCPIVETLAGHRGSSA